MRLPLAILFALLAVSVKAATLSRISIDVTVTNVAETGDTMALAGAVRTFTNAHSSTTILTNLVSKNATATNVFNVYSSYPLGSGITHAMVNTNVVRFTAPLGFAFTGAATGDWATITIRTQSGPETFTAMWPLENMVGETNRTNQGSSLVYGLGIYSTNAFPTNSTALSNFITKGASAIQTVSSPLNVSGNLRAQNGLYGTNGFLSSVTNINPVLSNGVNYGSSFSSPGTEPGSQQFGGGSAAGLGTAIGTSSSALTNGTALGWFASAGRFGVAIGASADSSAGTNAIAIGQGASVGFSSNAVAFGNSTLIGDRHHNSIVIGHGAASTTNDQVVLGASTHTVTIPGMLNVTGTITNATIRGTNTVNAITVYTPTANSSLANGYNSGVAVNATYVRFSGPTAAYTNVGFSAANKMDGKSVLCQFDNPGLSFTLLHDSGLDSGDTNRIYTGTGALLNSTNNPVFVGLIYDNSVTRWRVVHFR